MQFLPLIARGFNKRSNVSYRARAIVAHLADTADIIGFNEVFDYQARALLIGGFKKAWGASFHHVVHPKGSNRINGGLLIVSRYPLVATHALHFRAASRFRDHGLAADGLVSKGVQHAAVRLSASLTIDLFATHLEARSEQARQAQYTELAQFIHKYGSSRRPSVLIGDFNTSGGEKEMARKGSAYQVMMRALRDTRNHDPMVDLWPKLNKRIIGTSNQLTDDGGRRIDYIMAAIPRSAQERFKPTALSVRQHRDAKVAALSNHSAVHCIFTWQAAP